MTLTKKELKWKETHLKNLIWSANKSGSLFKKSDAIRFKKQLKIVRDKLKNLKENNK